MFLFSIDGTLVAAYLVSNFEELTICYTTHLYFC